MQGPLPDKPHKKDTERWIHSIWIQWTANSSSPTVSTWPIQRSTIHPRPVWQSHRTRRPMATRTAATTTTSAAAAQVTRPAPGAANAAAVSNKFTSGRRPTFVSGVACRALTTPLKDSELTFLPFLTRSDCLRYANWLSLEYQVRVDVWLFL